MTVGPEQTKKHAFTLIIGAIIERKYTPYSIGDANRLKGSFKVKNSSKKNLNPIIEFFQKANLSSVIVSASTEVS